jgi:DNA-binding IclR family transcriptional regulator
VSHSKVFMLLQQKRHRSWSAVEIAAELKISPRTAADVLERLASNNFLDVKISSDLRYRFNPATPALEASADRSGGDVRKSRRA